MNVYGIGDSHIRGFRSMLTHWVISASTAYGLMNEHSETQARNKILAHLNKVPKGAWLVLSFGEVDCRVHIPKFDNVYEAAQRSVERYFKFIDEIKERKPIIFCPVPNLYWKFTSEEDRKLREYQHGKYIISGTYADRIMATASFTKFANIEAKKRGIPTVSVFNEVLNRPKFFWDWIHLNDDGNQIVIERIKKICKI